MTTTFVSCTLLDGTKHMAPQPGISIRVEDGKITAIGTASEVKAEGSVIDLAGKYLMPGLINLHVHLPGDGRPKKKQQDSTKLAQLVLSNPLTRLYGRSLCEKYAKMELLSGVTTIRTVGGLGSLDAQIRDRALRGKIDAPRMLVCNTAVSVPGGHMAGSVAVAATSEVECRALVRQCIADGADWVKIMITGGVLDAKKKGEPGELKMPPEYVRACCDEAHKAGYKVAAHTESTEGVRVALENGVDTIEHGAAADEEILNLFALRGAADVCTISPAVPLAKFGPEVMHSTEMTRFNGQMVMDGIISCARAALDRGIPVGLGTDTACPYVTHYDMWRELAYFEKYVGVSRAFALYTATKRNAEIAGIGDVTGSVAVGKEADFLVTEKNPLDDLSALRTPAMVVARGRVYDHPVVKKYPECEQQLDACL